LIEDEMSPEAVDRILELRKKRMNKFKTWVDYSRILVVFFLFLYFLLEPDTYIAYGDFGIIVLKIIVAVGSMLFYIIAFFLHDKFAIELAGFWDMKLEYGRINREEYLKTKEGFTKKKNFCGEKYYFRK